MYDEDLNANYSGVIETDMPASGRPDRCFIAFTVETVGEAPLIDPGSPPPLPDLEVWNLSEEPSSGNLAVQVRNVGQATWLKTT